MPISMYSMSVPAFVRTLTAMLGQLDAAEAHAKARGFDPDSFVSFQLPPDMRPYSFQIQTVSDMAKSAVARLAGIEAPSWADDEATLSELRARITKTIDYVHSISEQQLEGSETREVELQAGPELKLKFSGEDYLKGFVLPNFYFHATMMYALLRQSGVPLGKMDFLGAP